MIIGIPKEIKNKENRVGMTPHGVAKLVKSGHMVYVEKNAGAGSGFRDSEYKKCGAKILPTATSVYKIADMIVKIKEPLEQEFKLIKSGQAIFTYLHLAAEKTLTKFLLQRKVTGIAYETVETSDHRLPLLEPMSQVAGRMSIQVGAHYLEKTNGGRGVLLGGTDTVKPAKVLILGYGTVGSNAAQMAKGLGANVMILDINDKTIAAINRKKNPLFKAKKSSTDIIAKEIVDKDLVIGAVLIPGAKAPKLVTKKMVKTMKQGSVIADVSIDQGGCVETSHPTSHAHPVFTFNRVIHYCVTNMPGAVARTSTIAITAATLPFVLKLANKGIISAIKFDPALAKGVNTFDGKLTYEAVARAFGLKYTKLRRII